MKKLYQKLQSAEQHIKECREEIAAVKRLPFYAIFKQEELQRQDLASLNLLLNELLSKKLSVLQQLEAEIKSEYLLTNSLLKTN